MITSQDIQEKYTTIHGDCVEAVRALPDSSVHLSVFSPPFASLYTFSDSVRDMSNVSNVEEFAAHYRFLVAELFRVMIPGRIVAIHCMPITATLTTHGFIGLIDLPGLMVRTGQEVGFIYHSEVTIWKDPVQAMYRSKNIGLLHKQLLKDSAISRQGLPDKIVVLRKPGTNPEPVWHRSEDLPVPVWQKWASPVWMDIIQGDTLQRFSAREEEDEKHIAPLQLEVIRRLTLLWSNPGDVVLSPFMGIGSEGYVALQEGRRFVGVELKESYYKQAVANLRNVKRQDMLPGITP
jgi:DNA modification methylase